jgi:hypothetical protein
LILHIKIVIAAIIISFLVEQKCFAQIKPFNRDTIGVDTASKSKDVTVIDKLEKFAKKDNLLAKLLRSVMVFESKKQVKDTTKVSEQKYIDLENKFIHNIDIVILGPFGYSVTERISRPINKLQRFGDNIHYPTRTWIIKDKLLFKVDDRIDALKIAESERLIRQAPYIVDAKITLSQSHTSNDSVDVMVIVQDIFNYSAGLAGDPRRPSGDFSVTDINFLGLGHRLDQKVWYDPQYSQHFKYSGSYNVSQIGNTYISGELHYNTVNYDKKTGFSFSRPFFSSTSKWAGGLDAEYIHEAYNVTLPNNNNYAGMHDYTTQDFWLGYAFNLNESPFYRFKKTQLIVSGKVYNINYINQASNGDDLNHFYQNDRLYLAGIGFTHREYYKDRYIFAFGKTEDIPIGFLLTFNTGPDIGQFTKRWYNGAKAAYGFNNSTIGYFYLSAETGGFINGQNIEQGLINTQLIYFTNLLPLGKWRIRQYIINHYTLGYNRRQGETLMISGSAGIPRFNAPGLTGTQRWANNYEADFFTPWKPFGFKMVFVAYMDDALLGDHIHTVLSSRLYQGYGIGVRFKNEHFIFNTLEIAFRYFPEATQIGGNPWKYVSTGAPNFQFQDFQFSEPFTAPFR